MLKLVITDDEGRTTVVPLDRDEMSIGRGEGNTIRLTERNVSRKHAVLRRTSRGFEIEDLKSYTGTKLGGVKITGAQPVRDGERIQIGDYQVTLQSSRQPVRVARDGTKTTQITADVDTALFAMPDARPAAPVAPRPIGKPRFIVEAGPNRGRQFVIDRDELSIGQAPECEVRLDHPSVSRTHAKIVNVGGVRILDLNSTNGVRVNGREVPYAELEPGDLLELGEVKLRFVIPGMPSRTGAAAPSRRGTWLAAGIVLGFATVGGILFFAWPGPSGGDVVITPDGPVPPRAPGNAAGSTTRPPEAPGPEFAALITSARAHQQKLAIDDAVRAATEAKGMQEAAGLSTEVPDRLLRDLERDRLALAELERARERVSTSPEEALAALDRIPADSVVATSPGVSRTAAEALRRQVDGARGLARQSSSRDDARAALTKVLAHPRLAPASLPSELDQVRASARELQASLAERVAAVGPRPPHTNNGHEPPTKAPTKAPDTPRPGGDEAARFRAIMQAASDHARMKRLACSFAHDFPSSPRAGQARQVCSGP